MQRITRTFDTKKQAENFEVKLWNKYARIELVSFPMFSEAGKYVWFVSY